MAKTTRLTQQDLQIYPSQRLTDTDDGGGLMVGTPLTGADNELFPPVSDVDRTMGSFDARLVYPAVLRNDAEPLYGSHFVISVPPEAGNVSFLVFKARNYGELRAEIMPRIEAYSVPTIESRMTLMGRHLAGIRIIQAYQRVEAPLPKIGERYCLFYSDRKGAENITRQQYFRVMDLDHEIRTFEYVRPSGEVVEFNRRVLKMNISGPLSHDYEGVDYPVIGYADNKKTKILETQVADSASYYGVRPLAMPAKKGDAEIKVDTIFEKLVPTSAVETAHADTHPVMSSVWVASAPRRVMYSGSGSVSGDVYLAQPVVPGTIELAGYTDNAVGQLIKGDAVLQVDYERGLIKNMPSTYVSAIYGVPGAKISAACYSAHINVKDTNQGQQWAPLLKPAPTRGSVVVSYMSYGSWYELRDYGDLILRDDTGAPCGSVESSGSVILSLPAVPDVGSRIIFSWAASDAFKTFDAKAAGSASVATSVSKDAVYPAAPQPFIKPGSVNLSWSGGAASDDGRRGLTGNVAGEIDYQAGLVRIPAGAPAAAVSFTAKRYVGEHVLRGDFQANGNGFEGVKIGACQPGTVVLYVWAEVSVSGVPGWLASSPDGWPYLPKELWPVVTKYASTGTWLRICDDGAGGLLLAGKKLSGASINYADGNLVLPNSAVKLDVQSYRSGKHTITVGAEALDFVAEMYKITEYTLELGKLNPYYINSPATEPVSGNSNGGSWMLTVLSGQYYGEKAVLDTWSFMAGNVAIIERGGVLYKDFNHRTGIGAVIGTLDSATGAVKISDVEGDYSDLKITGGIVASTLPVMYSYSGRAPAAPVKPESFTVYSGKGESAKSATADEAGVISGDFDGKIDYETGAYQIKSEAGFNPLDLRYNMVTQNNIPLDSSIIGIDAVRLPPDGRVPIFRKGDMVVIGNKLKQDLGSAFTGGQAMELQRKNIDRLCLLDANGKHVLSDKYSTDLKAGTITFAEPLNLSEYQMPLSAEQAWEEENRVVGADISGRLKLQFGLGRDYPADNTYVSSAVIGGDLLVRYTEPFSQQAWDRIWRDTISGDEILARLNVKDYPIKLTSAGAVTERWLIVFVSDSQFELYGERLGLVAKGDILSPLAPVNPATNKPYFTLPHLAFGGGWSRGNCIRFNTFGTQLPVWILRAVQPSPIKQSQRDGFSACLRGNTIVES
ncbi:hypothetical protein [Neisseria sp. S1]|uniref:hypothetical protein n=1 Tax=Neisseria sp. S1 TaxID=3318354 RepID=UPI003A884F3E